MKKLEFKADSNFYEFNSFNHLHIGFLFLGATLLLIPSFIITRGALDVPIYFQEFIHYIYFFTNDMDEITDYGGLVLVAWFLYYITIAEVFLVHYFKTATFLLYEGNYERVSSVVIPNAVIIYVLLIFVGFDEGFHFIEILSFIVFSFILYAISTDDKVILKISKKSIEIFLSSTFVFILCINIFTSLLLFWQYSLNKI